MGKQSFRRQFFNKTCTQKSVYFLRVLQLLFSREFPLEFVSFTTLFIGLSERSLYMAKQLSYFNMRCKFFRIFILRCECSQIDPIALMHQGISVILAIYLNACMKDINFKIDWVFFMFFNRYTRFLCSCIFEWASREIISGFPRLS